MSSIIATNIPSTVTVEKLQEFFSFCGDVKSINPLGSGKYEVNFKSEKALSTALLLNDAELEGSSIKVEENKLPTYEEVPDKKPEDVGTSDEKKSFTATGDHNYDDIEQEEKPKYAIMAQLLSQGYGISDQMIEKSISFDKEHGYSTRFKGFVKSLDEKYIHLQNPESKSSKLLGDLVGQGKVVYGKFNKYFEQLAENPYGAKVHDFYKNLAGDVKDVHLEAKRLNQLKKEEDAKSGVDHVSAIIDKQ
ncbi:Protein vip1 [Yamadazyma tenuis]|uniref:RRM domain-containing protein n=1 Tax=Candida tenuis (strain ATCC 10573 / BCRC 21748 / CBS 615 / JCM 9827 / NBRC 10315 / NRRL Y-1498 / VKM Y-70) TaxID=590646 RepID=G3BDC1_CANTC|nr:uncharacterized protein CANTEDRAFT_132558 [Yamadazyma tenuis ATCC 10573]XP_006690139.1 uncharacterized protein CANTEDRAFT_132558 [Yamadazyma tenuis ATCC 10573]EGV60924.1 hypothetical protein CANTEDRAFT_132558 [Yamadazyma tenuis ATCC 10573]EGV60925.1 hypothetical protein CANTEDRAFT_132558 [Yamadazyma tenuis ATCC 10573]WEJ93802.1 Protein vip1 [Yamadazyma tenuis]